MILTKNEIDDQEHNMWNEIFGNTSNIPADGEVFYKPFIHIVTC